MQQHYFIGIPIPAQNDEIAEKFKQDYSLHTTYKVITHKDDLHVTLLYLGAVDNQHLPKLQEQLTEIALTISPFSLWINGLSYFGSQNGPRVVYLSVGENGQLTKLQGKINDSIPSLLGIPKTDRFVPHVTIAKKRKTNEKTVIEKQKITPVKIAVPAFSLFTIHPNRIPKYEIIKNFHFTHS